MNVLLCGHRSFAAKGLVAVLRRAGHEVTAFGRGPVGRSCECAPDGGEPLIVVRGPVERMHENPQLCAPPGGSPFDAVINYILLKDDGVDENVAYVDSLLRFCREQPGRAAAHLIHISSVSSYRASERVIDESAEIETDPARKGSYGSLKVATDLFLLRHTPNDMKLTLVRPGFVLGAGLVNPIIGTAARLPWNRLLIIGNGKSVIPMTTRDLCNDAVTRTVSNPPADNREVLVLADPASPTRVEFLEEACRGLGIGTGVTSLPTWVWWLLALGGEAVARLIGQRKLQPYSKLTARLTRQRFDTARTSGRLGTSLSVDWRSALRGSLDGQEANYDLPAPAAGGPIGMPTLANPANAIDPVTFLGFGRIVRQKYLPALNKLGLSGNLQAFDLRASEPDGNASGIRVEPINGADLPKTGLFVVASPGPAHTEAIDLLRDARGVILVEKPLCYSKADLDKWAAFAAGRTDPVYVCHNYRFKQNVARMMAHLARWNPGRLHHAELQFQSPPAANDSVAWLRDERRARTLLLDYAIHFLDVACLFGPRYSSGRSGSGEWEAGPIRHELDSHGQTELIEGRVRANYTVHFLLRQGFGPRRARVRFTFQNYDISLGFFPDTFVAHMSDDNPWLHKAEAAESRRQTVRKVLDKLGGTDSDASHARMLAEVINRSEAVAQVAVPRLEPFYKVLFEIAESVYGG